LFLHSSVPRSAVETGAQGLLAFFSDNRLPTFLQSVGVSWGQKIVAGRGPDHTFSDSFRNVGPIRTVIMTEEYFVD
jgi:hypothetical protein